MDNHDYSPTQRAIEKAYQKPLPDILVDLYDKHQSIDRVAADLGITQPTLSRWLMQFDLHIVKRLEKGK